MKDEDVKHVVKSEHSKANYAERVITNIKSKLGIYIKYNKTHKWIDVLPDVTNSYNKTFNKLLKCHQKKQ